jgi:kinesin family protein 15
VLHANYNHGLVYIILQMKDDSKNGLYVENLIEEYVTCYDDVAQILIKVEKNPSIYY